MRVANSPLGALCAAALSLSVAAHASTFKTLYNVGGSTDGTSPSAGLVDLGGVFYGTTKIGGLFQQGTVFKLDPATGTETTLYAFTGKADGEQPSASLTIIGGVLFGVTSNGGPYNAGTLFQLDPTTGDFSVLHAFGYGGDGLQPAGALVAIGSDLYGLTSEGGPAGGGIVFKVDSTTGAETILHGFSGDGDGLGPTDMIQSGSALYGTTSAGGAYDCGIVFKIDPASGAEAVVHSLYTSSDGCGPTGLTQFGGNLAVVADNGGTYGSGTVFQLDPATGAARLLHAFEGGSDGAGPLAAGTKVGGVLYGTTVSGGTSDLGTIFALNLSTGAESVVHSFSGAADGTYPQSSLLALNGLLYGTAYGGGAYGGGTAFAFDPSSGALTLDHSFPSQSGTVSGEGLLAARKTIYFTQGQGGPLNAGAIVQIAPSSGAAQVVASFGGAGGGATPQAPLILKDGTFYGTTMSGGTAGEGTVFSVDAKTDAIALLHSFSGGNDGAYPAAPLLFFKGALFGTTNSGGANAFGTLFKLDPATGAETLLHAFAGGNDGTYPSAGLTEMHGLLYGTTETTIFMLDPATGTTTTVYNLDGNSGYEPHGLLRSGTMLYGNAFFGGSGDAGTVFSFDPATAFLKVLYSFTGGTDGRYPGEQLVALHGILYGTTEAGGATEDGTVFKLDPVSGAEAVVYDFTNGSDGGEPCAPMIVIHGVLYGGTCSGGAGNLGTVFSLQP